MFQIFNFVVEDDTDTHPLDASDFGFKNLTGQAVGRDAEVHHAARKRSGVADLNFVTF